MPEGIGYAPVVDENLVDPHLEIKEKIDFWRSRMQEHLYRFNTHADYWRLIKPPRPKDLSGFANPQVTETNRATEAIATFMYRALTSAQPNFQLMSSNPMISQENLWTREQVIEWQKTVTNYNRKLLKACRSVALFGTVPVEEPWVMNLPYWESTGFIPRSLLQVAFDPMAFDISMSGWHAVIEFVTEDMLLDLPRRMPGVWDEEMIRSCIDLSSSEKNLSPELLARLSSAGYTNYAGDSNKTSHLYQLVTYYGSLRDDKTHSEWVVSTLNDLKTIRGHQLVYRRRPFAFSHLSEFEMEPYGYGVGRIAETMQPEINQNRGRMHDTITFSLFNIWLANSAANIKNNQLKAKPWSVINVDGDPDNSLKALRPQLEGVNFGVILEKLMKEEFRSTTGASDGLQAIVTQATATESSIAQNEAVRRLSVISEMQAEPLLREHISKMDENNRTFLDQPFSIGVTGNPKPLRVYPAAFDMDVDVQIKVVTDKDFRPERNKALLQFLQIATSIRNQNPQVQQINLEPIVEEFARGVNINPKRVWSVIPQGPGLPAQAGGPRIPGGMDRLNQLAGRMNQIRSQAGELGQEALEGVAQ